MTEIEKEIKTIEITYAIRDTEINGIKISKDDYEELVSFSECDDRTIYIVYSDIVDVYGQRIINVADADGLSDAVNLGVLNKCANDLSDGLTEYVDEVSGSITNYVDSISDWISSNFSIEDETADSTVLRKNALSGNNTYLSGKLNSAVLENGDNCVASGKFAHAEGSNTFALSTASHAEGGGTKAKELVAHAEGAYTTASGVGSHSEGIGMPVLPDEVFLGVA